MPSRRFYAAKFSDFEELRKTVKRKRLSLKKRPAEPTINLINEPDNADISSRQLNKIEDIIKKVDVYD